VFKGLSDKG